MGSLGVMDVTLTGGEALIRSDFRQLVEAVVRNRMRFQLLSNGALLTDELASFLAATGRCNIIQISLDGSSAAVHDICRGRGAFEGAVRGIRTAQRHGLPLTARLTIQHHNVYDLENTARFLLETLGLPNFGTNAAGYLGTCRQNADDVLLTLEERQHAMRTLLQLDAHYPGRVLALAGPLADGKSWQQMEQARLQDAPAFPHGGRLTGCGCVFSKLSVRADGCYVPCNLLSHLVLGRVGEDSLLKVWQSSSALNAMRQRREINLATFVGCQGCNFLPYCTGNCPALAYTQTGQVDHPNPDACLRSYLQAGGQIIPVIDQP
jgi:SynChlorMet cassette radical SAM/SPASM protein ScmE